MVAGSACIIAKGGGKFEEGQRVCYDIEGKEMTEKNTMQKESFLSERIVSLIVLVLIIITIWYMLDIVLLTFIVTFIFYHLVHLIQKQNKKMIPISIPDGLVLSILYILFILLLTIGSIELAPKLAAQFTEIANIFINFDIGAVKAALDPDLAKALSHIDFNKYITTAGEMLAAGVTTVGSFGLKVFLSLILSFLLLLEKSKIKRFGDHMYNSRISYIYTYVVRFGCNFAMTFGKVMRVQVTIAFINAIASMIMLTFLGFPQVMSLGLMIFALGLIPVAGVTISLIPLSIIAFNIGGLSKVVAVIVMIILIHTIEAYILNPKLMSEKTELPVCFVFIILLVGEHYLGVWGLLIGVPIFIFLLNAFGVNYEEAEKEKKKKSKAYKVLNEREESEEEA